MVQVHLFRSLKFAHCINFRHSQPSTFCTLTFTEFCDVFVLRVQRSTSVCRIATWASMKNTKIALLHLDSTAFFAVCMKRKWQTCDDLCVNNQIRPPLYTKRRGICNSGRISFFEHFDWAIINKGLHHNRFLNGYVHRKHGVHVL